MYPSFRKLKLTFISISCILAFVMVLEHSSVSSSVTSAASVRFLVPKPPIKKKPKAIATAQKSWLEVQKALLMSQHPERLWRCYKQLWSLHSASEVSDQEEGLWMADGEGSPGGNEPPIIWQSSVKSFVNSVFCKRTVRWSSTWIGRLEAHLNLGWQGPLLAKHLAWAMETKTCVRAYVKTGGINVILIQCIDLLHPVTVRCQYQVTSFSRGLSALSSC